MAADFCLADAPSSEVIRKKLVVGKKSNDSSGNESIKTEKELFKKVTERLQRTVCASSYHLERQVSNLVALVFSKLSKERNEKFVKFNLI